MRANCRLGDGLWNRPSPTFRLTVPVAHLTRRRSGNQPRLPPSSPCFAIATIEVPVPASPKANRLTAVTTSAVTRSRGRAALVMGVGPSRPWLHLDYFRTKAELVETLLADEVPALASDLFDHAHRRCGSHRGTRPELSIDHPHVRARSQLVTPFFRSSVVSRSGSHTECPRSFVIESVTACGEVVRSKSSTPKFGITG